MGNICQYSIDHMIFNRDACTRSLEENMTR